MKWIGAATIASSRRSICSAGTLLRSIVCRAKLFELVGKCYERRGYEDSQNTVALRCRLAG
ncbi:hypothetical protein [Mycolicibacterium holsaticum]|uniref:hypothetical protein n=1 Tax=Mycolicibacterium holsaticum TaxID=152142 RepID=UPI001041E272|nr:hypothetical protein [Mycolicibacterium holsaticum]